MAKSRTTARLVQTFNRPGEGTALQIVGKEVRTGAHGEMLSAVKFDLSAAPVPDRQYVATVASIVVADEFVHLLFGQKRTAGTGLRSLIDIQITPEAVRRLHEAIEGFQQARVRSGIKTGALVTFEEEPPQTVGLSANVLALSFNGIESCIDLYKFSPFVLGNLARGGELLAEPVVRVSLPTGVLFAMMDRFQELWGAASDGLAKEGAVP